MKKTLLPIVVISIFLITLSGCNQDVIDESSDQDLETTSVEEPEEDSSSLPAGVEWLTYSDEDISFTYPKTFLGTEMQEDFDKNLASEQW